MSDQEIGKRMGEEAILEAFEAAYPQITGRDLVEVTKSESPDFLVVLGEENVGLEISEIRNCEDVDDYLAEVWRLADQKNNSYKRRGLFEISIFLIFYSYKPPIYEIQKSIEVRFEPDDFDGLSFEEVWLMDLSEEYFSYQDPRRPADMFCLKPGEWRGFYRIGSHGRKPYG